MLRSAHVAAAAVPLALLALSACDGGEKPDGPFALGYDGGEDCVEADVSGQTVPAAWTIELWLRGDPAELDRPRPFVEWRGLFALGAAVGGDTTFTVGTADGVAWNETLMDGVLHHVAGTFDGTQAALFVDGVKQGFADGAPEASPTPTLRFGCDASAQAYEGLLDDVRLSSVVRYTDDFEPTPAAFAADADTVLLFAFDEGEGEETVDAVGGVVAGVYGPEWVPFDLSDGE